MKLLPPKFCNQCGGKLIPALATAHGGPPLTCSVCGTPAYLDPKVAAATLILKDGGVVMVRRAQHDVAHGLWIMPGGHVDAGEVVEEAAVREAAEETGLTVEIEELLGVYSYPGNSVVLVVYVSRPIGGEITPGREALEVKVFGLDSLPWDELGFPSTGHALRDLIKLLDQRSRD